SKIKQLPTPKASTPPSRSTPSASIASSKASTTLASLCVTLQSSTHTSQSTITTTGSSRDRQQQRPDAHQGCTRSGCRRAAKKLPARNYQDLIRRGISAEKRQ